MLALAHAVPETEVTYQIVAATGASPIDRRTYAGEEEARSALGAMFRARGGDRVFDYPSPRDLRFDSSLGAPGASDLTP
jgi:hypothetical protein